MLVGAAGRAAGVEVGSSGLDQMCGRALVLTPGDEAAAVMASAAPMRTWHDLLIAQLLGGNALDAGEALE